MARKPSTSQTNTASPARVQRPHRRPIALVGLAALAVAVFASGALVLQHLGAMNIPGCGDGSPCADLSRTAWGRVPFLDLSTASLGFAYFLGMGAAWLVWGVVRPSIARVFLALASMGGVASVIFLVVMLAEGKLCRYCLAAHMANLTFIATAFLARDRAASSAPGVQQLTAAFGLMIAAGAGLLTLESAAQTNAAEKQEAQLAEAVKTLTQPPAASPTSVQEVQPSIASPLTDNQAAPPATPPTAAVPGVLTGRFPSAPTPAPIRIVMFTDYQCPDCRILEAQLEHVKKTYPGVSASIRFYPFSTICNSRVTENMHPDACFAASAALAVGTLGGADAFWDIHGWLFERKGAFTAQQLSEKVSSMGLDAAAVVATVNARSNFDEIKSDIAMGNELGLRYTPMIFINGVELKGFTASHALVRAVDALAKTNPAPATADSDRPPLAAERYLADWREAPAVTMPERFSRRWLGDAGAATTIILVGDYMEPGTAEVDAAIRAFIQRPGVGVAEGADVRYNFVQFPMNQDCNPQITFTKFQGTCLAARAAEGAALVGGPEGFWRMHEWLMNNRTILTEELVRNGAPALQLDADQLTLAMQQRTVADELNEDALGVLSLGVTSLPTIYINNKPAVSWKAGDENLIPRLIEESRRR